MIVLRGLSAPPPLLNVSFKNVEVPILPPNPASAFDSTVCMNPNINRVGDEWRLFYAGADNSSTHRILLATAPVSGPTPAGAKWTRRGVVVDVGRPGAFNSLWSVLPLLHKFGGLATGDVWHLYFTGRSTSCPYSNGTGLQSFWGIGLATSTDGRIFVARDAPVILGNATKEFPRNFGVAGGGSIVETRVGGRLVYRMYYTLAVGTPSPDVHVDQKKVCAVAHSHDGVGWFNHSVVLGPSAATDREDVACAAPDVWVDGAGVYRMVFSAIGTRWGAYSLAQAVSTDGYTWTRGDEAADADLVLAPDPRAGKWDHQMVEYASVWRAADARGGSMRLGLFYAGNGYGRGGIGYTESVTR